MDEKTNLLVQVEEFVKETLQRELPKGVVYHDLHHTEQVVEAAREIGQHSGLSDAELEIVILAAWFHDLGFKDKTGVNHEEASASLAADFLRGKNYDEAKIKQVESCIMATR
ncbi:MAG: HD domain-containing protein, partial [Cyclobacteriaceae bacterium]